MKVVMYTDGACRGNPGPGGWGVVYERDGVKNSLSGGSKSTTNNRMELQAAIEGLNAIEPGAAIDLYTDSEYVKKGITEWIHSWRKKNWKNSRGQPVKNQDLWQQLDAAILQHEVAWHWVRGHSGNPGNELADELARVAIDSLFKDSLCK